MTTQATELPAALTDLDGARQNLTGDLEHSEWDSANKALTGLTDALEALGAHIDPNDPDEENYNTLVAAYNAAVDHHNHAIDVLAAAGQLHGARIGDTRPCGCPVEPLSEACERCDQAYGQAMTDCSDCRFGVPGVRHWNNGCRDPK